MKLNRLKFNLFKKYFVSTSIVFIVCLTAMFLIISTVFTRFFSKEKFDKLKENCDSVCSVAAIDYTSSEFQRNIYNIAMSVSNASDVDIFITDNTGNIYICSCQKYGKGSECVHSGKTIPESILRKTVSGKYKEIGNFNGLFDGSYYCVGGVIYGGGYEVLGYVYSCSDSSSLLSLYYSLVKLYAVSALTPLLIMFILFAVITYKMTMPLKMMSEAAKNMAKGDFSKRIPVTTNDEIGELANSFNQMTESLFQLENVRRSFVANVSHELKTPMTTISGFIDGMLDGTIPLEKQSYYLNIVSDEVKRLSRLVQAMLSMSRLESGEVKLKLEKFNFTELLITIVIGQEQRISDKAIDIIGLDEMDDIYINADRDLIHQAIYNIVDNAIKFTPEKGIITFNATLDNGDFIFTSANTGIGIPKEDLQFVFDRFYKTDKSRSIDKKGVGLGLHLVKTIIKLHGGDIFVQSEQNVKTEFIIKFGPDRLITEDNYGEQ